MERSLRPNETLRRLWASDFPAYRAHLLRLGPKARYSRFFGAMSDDVIMRHAEKCFGPDCLLYGYFADGVLSAAAELHVIDPGATHYTGEAEAAFSVERDQRHSGVGSLLMGRLLRAARNRRLRKIVFTCLPQNVAMQSLAKKFGAKLRFGHDEVLGELAAHLPTMQSIFAEIVDDSFGFAEAAFDLQQQIFHPSYDRGHRLNAA
jgi:RimJ/RimL family protein N-acetyltransferase